MWVVKLGGSLARDPRLTAWLRMLAEFGGGRVTVVPGGADFADAVRQFRDLAQASHDRPGAALVALARHLDVQLDSQFAQRGMTLSDAAALKAALLAVLAPHADAADAALERWVQAQTRVRSDDLRDALQRNPAFARRHAEVIKAWQAQPPLRRDPKDLERDLERLHLEMLGSR